MTDRFILKDETGTVIARKSMAEHIKVLLDDMKPESGRHFVVKSEVSGYELNVTDSTTTDDWRTYCDKCLMALY